MESDNAAQPQIKCGYDQILSNYFGCYKCPFGTKPDITGKFCNNFDDYVDSSANAWYDFYNQGTTKNNCGYDQIQTSEGGCYTCHAGTKPDITGQLCNNIDGWVDSNVNTWYDTNTLNNNANWVDPNANMNNINWFDPSTQWDINVLTENPYNACNEIQINVNGVCELCPLFTRAQAENTFCGHNCYQDQTVDIFGLCVDTYTPPTNVVPQYSTNFYGITCNDIQIRTSDGTGCQTCPPYTRAQYNGTVCEANKCNQYSIINVAGHCNECGAGYFPDLYLRRCILAGGAVAPIQLVAIKSMVEPASSDTMEPTRITDVSKNSFYLIIASGVGIVAIIGVVGLLFCNRIINSKGSQQQEPVTEEMSNIEAVKEQPSLDKPIDTKESV